MSARPENVGILAMEMYFPKRFVSQEVLEVNDNCKGKYVIGLGQHNMAFCDDREDINSIFLTVTHNLLEKYNISPSQIGRVEVGTETLIDKSKSSKTALMRLFGENTDLEGVTSVNACYGGTAALFNSIAWVESSEWDGRFALVVCGDIAVYESGPARPTGGCGALALLIGPNAPLALEPGVRASHALDIMDFYKPRHSEYAMVDGKLSQWAYLSSVDSCYAGYKAKYAKRYPDAAPITQDHFDYFAFHSPYNKLVQKGFGRLSFMDARQSAAPCGESNPLAPYTSLPLSETYENRDVENACKVASQSKFGAAVTPACRINQNIGNCYTGSVFSSLLSVVSEAGASLVGKRVMMFSYGSGSVASIYSFVGRVPDSSVAHGFTLERIQVTADVFNRLASRQSCHLAEFETALSLREAKYGQAPMAPDGSLDFITPGTYFISSVTSLHHRIYERKA